MLFLIQNTQNRDSAALHLKLHELIRVNEAARNKLLDLEDLTQAELEHMKGSFTKLAGKAPDEALLREAADGLDAAGAEIEGARDKVAAGAEGKAAKPGSLVAHSWSIPLHGRVWCSGNQQINKLMLGLWDAIG